jgi:hypothetical protein
MSLRDLTVAQMVQLSHAFVSAGPARSALLGNPMLAALLPAVESAHTALHDSQATKSSNHDLQELMAEAAEVDARHDEAIRGAHAFLTGLAALTGEQKYVDLRDILLPKGLRHTRLRYDEEAGEARLLVARMTNDPSLKKDLKEIPVGKKTLLAQVEGWIADATRLGEIEVAKANAATSAAPATSASDVRDLRNRWVRAIRSLETVAELAELNEATHETIFGRLEAVAKAATPQRASAAAPSTNNP